MRHSQSQVRWVPHELMLVDSMTKVDLAKSNDSMSHLLRRGVLRLVQESAEMRRRSKGRDEGHVVGRSKAVSRRRWDEEQTLSSFVQSFGSGTKWQAFESELSD